jgi:hypothetical protein
MRCFLVFLGISALPMILDPRDRSKNLVCQQKIPLPLNVNRVTRGMKIKNSRVETTMGLKKKSFAKTPKVVGVLPILKPS